MTSIAAVAMDNALHQQMYALYRRSAAAAHGPYAAMQLAAHYEQLFAHTRSGATGKRKQLGAYYTPPGIVDLVIREALDPLVNEAQADHISVLSLKILDPAVGSGRFLIAAASYLADKLAIERGSSCTASFGTVVFRNNEHSCLVREVVDNCLYGIDIEPSAVLAARLTLRLATGQMETGDIPMESRISCRDSLQIPVDKGSYDAVIGNPPWVSIKGKHGTGVWGTHLTSEMVSAYGADSYRPNLIEFFIRMALSCLREGGYHSFIVPDRLARNLQFAQLRKLLFVENAPRSLVFGVRFPGVTADCMVYSIRKGKAATEEALVWDYASSNHKTRVAAAALCLSPDFAIQLPHAYNVQALIAKLMSSPTRLFPHIARTNTGFIAAKEAIKQKPAPDLVPVLKGRNVFRYSITGCYYVQPVSGSMIGGTQNPRILGASPKVLVRKTGNRLYAALCEEPIWPEQSLYQVWGFRPGIDPLLVVGVLNSRLAQFLYSRRLVTNPYSMPHLKKVDLDSMPFPSVDHSNPLALEIASLACEMSRPENPSAGEDIERRIDDLIFRIYELSEDEISLVRGT